MASRPLVAIPADAREIGPHPFHVVGDKYIRAVSHGADCLPFLLPALGDWFDVAAVLDRVDGLFLTGSPSNLHPRHYGLPDELATPPFDPHRDATTLPLLKAALDRGMPVFVVCRGFQELNVALGGTLHPRVQEVPGLMDHREDKDQPVEVQYGPAHTVRLTPGGRFAQLTGRAELTVNSLHQQGIDRLAPGLDVEATAPDGLVEGVSVRGHPFALGTQWHPEWRFWEDPASTALFAAFGQAVRDFAGRGR
ncbi:gamma-glutamyl-gamma-aminobutyrate hydrolase family protein [Aerophototrophica crusticola]|uniref:gamma-glutamyl-gamma-aminobutyrate hydrolase n=1 Tax=Aerophototrophica crusticola TaxID=1709002 RepID=A0A858R9Q5_9PROT|nr:gamma-glutamyl-gamma-aminobutyrate hydrolase family protein [Rhodospirillaceae bacterium B3]